MTECVGSSSTNKGLSIGFHTQVVIKLLNECGQIGDKISSNSPIIELALSLLGGPHSIL